ncbi:unnamed protein product, partial [Mesorhabditis spiculigera]
MKFLVVFALLIVAVMALGTPCDIKKGVTGNSDCKMAGETCEKDLGSNIYRCVIAMDRGVNWVLTPRPKKLGQH